MKRKMSPSMKKAWIRFTVLLILAILFLSFALFAGVLAPFDPLESHYADMLKAPNSTYIFGTDQLGRDLFSRILYGGKSSLLIAFTVTAIISSVGILVGTIAGFTGGIFDNLLMRFSDMLMAFPGYIFTIALVSFIGVGLPNMILAMSLTGWTYYARISRSLVLSVKNNVYIEQARLGGASNWKNFAALYYSECVAVAAGQHFPGYRRRTADDIPGFLFSGLARRLRRRSGALCFQKERTTCIPLRGC